MFGPSYYGPSYFGVSYFGTTFVLLDQRILFTVTTATPRRFSSFTPLQFT